jgi:transcriptional regulator with XRE-family HTH domain
VAQAESPERLIERVARRVVELRRDAGLTQEQLAEALDVTVQQVGKWEVGENLTLASMARMATALGVPAIELLRPPKPVERTTKRGRGRPRKS